MNDINLQNLDSTDIEILKKLSKDCRKSFREIGRELGKSPTTVSKHVEELIGNKIINGFGVNIEYENLGFDIIALVELTISQGKMLEVENDLAKNPHIFGVYDVTGTYDALILARFKTRKGLSDMVKDINSKPYVEHTNTHLILNVIKEGTNFTELMES